MIAWKPMVVYGGPNHLHQPWGPPMPRPWGKPYPGNRKKNNPVAWGPPQPKNIKTSAFDAPGMSVADHEKRYHSTQPFDAPDLYWDDYEQGNLSKSMTTTYLVLQLHLWYHRLRTGYFPNPLNLFRLFVVDP